MRSWESLLSPRLVFEVGNDSNRGIFLVFVKRQFSMLQCRVHCSNGVVEKLSYRNAGGLFDLVELSHVGLCELAGGPLVVHKLRFWISPILDG